MSDSSPVSISELPTCPPAEAVADASPPVPPHLQWLEVESLDLEAQGVAHRADGKVVFIEDALPGEQVRVQVVRRKNNWEQATMAERRLDSAQRVTPRCTYFGLCGGCKMQHFHPAAQVAVKQRVLEDNLWHLGKVRPEMILRPIQGPSWGYRYRARLSVRYVAKKGTVLIGFHERKSRYVADMQTCEILPPHVSRLLMPLRELIGGMDQRNTLPQIEVAVGSQVTVLVLRHLEALSDRDRELLRQFAIDHSPAEGGRPRCRGGCSPRGLTPCIRWTPACLVWTTPCLSSASPCRSSPPISPRSTTPSTRCWWGERCACWRFSRTSV